LNPELEFVKGDSSSSKPYTGTREDVDNLQGSEILTGNGELVEQADFAENQ
jgi:hypothetical protein